MSQLVLINGLTFADQLDHDKDMKIVLEGFDIYINKTEAEAIVNHLAEVFSL